MRPLLPLVYILTTLQAIFVGLLLIPTFAFTQEIIYVNNDANGANTGLSWEDAYSDLQEALKEAEYGDQIWVAEGTYKPVICLPCDSTDRTFRFQLDNGVKLIGGFSGVEQALSEREADSSSLFFQNLTVLSGDIGVEDDHSDNSYTVVFTEEADSTTFFDGFMVIHGNANGRYDLGNLSPSSGGGMFNESSNLVIQNSVFLENRSVADGGGIYNNKSSPCITSTYFINNKSEDDGGGLFVSRGNPVVSRCFFIDNSAINGAGIFNSRGNTRLTYCFFSQNQSDFGGGGIYFQNSAPEIKYTSFLSNYARVGGGVFNISGTFSYASCNFENDTSFSGGAMYNERSEVFVSDCSFINNRAGNGGGITNIETSGQYHRCTFEGNFAYERGGAINNSLATDLISNCLITRNSSRISGGGIYEFNSQSSLLSNTLLSNSSPNGSSLAYLGSKPEISNSTFFGNQASNRGTIALLGTNSITLKNLTISQNMGSGIAISNTDSVWQLNTIIASNLEKDIENESGVIISLGHNLIGNKEGSNMKFLKSDLTGTSSFPINPHLGSLANYGGPTPTLALLPGSPAIGKGPPISSFDELTDQRGYSRIIGSKNDSIDIGAFEYQESHTSQDITQICDSDPEFLIIPDIVLSDSTGGAWPIDSNQSVVLNLPDRIEVNSEDVEFDFLGEGIEKVDAFVADNQIHLTYNRSYTTTPNSIRISGLKLKAPLEPGFYDILRSGEGNAIQNGNNPEDLVSHGRIWVLPTVTEFPYEDSFEEKPIWQAELSSPLWQWGVPNDTRINSASEGEKVFMTNLNGSYEPNKHTWIYSPCMDLSSLENPTLSFDYWTDIENQIDGAVMQYSIDRGDSWKTLGSDSTGRNWYNSSSIVANPADQDSSQQFGWTGQSNGWKRATHRLSDETRNSSMRLRLVFRSGDFVNPIDQFNGVAIDNLAISDYQKNVLGELFVQEIEELEDTFDKLRSQFDNELITITYPLFDNSTEIDSRNNFYGRRENNTREFGV